ncbi:helix-turn-helix domain-containing protein [Streptomyces sp. MAR4 CNY-716]
MTHHNAPLSPEGRRRLVQRCRTRPIAHVAAEMGISRACASKWVNRYRQHGELGLPDRSATPRRQPTATRQDVVVRIEALRRTEKWSASRIAFELQADGISLSRRTVSRHLLALGLNRRRFIDPSGDTNRRYNRILAEEFLYARTWHSEAERRDALGVWNAHYNYHRPHGAAGGQPPAQRLRAGVTNVLASYS